MNVVLLKEVQGLGHAGDVKDVSDGYGRNFLIPRGLAAVLTAENLRAVEVEKFKKEKAVKNLKKVKDKLAKKIFGKKFEIAAKADETGTLYAKIDAKAIASELAEQGFKIEANEIKLPAPIKKIGEYEVDLELGGGSGKIKVEVKSER